MKRIICLLCVILIVVLSLSSCLSITALEKLMEANKDRVDPPLESDEIDFITIANTVVPTALTASVRIEAEFGNILTGITTRQGSGVCFDKLTVGCYILTNYHVIRGDSESGGLISLVVYDAYDNAYSASIEARSPERDLAVLYVRSSNDIGEAPLAKENPSRGSFVFSISSPGGIKNTVSYGNVNGYVNLENDELDFAVINHDAPTDHGSSGGGLFDKDGNLVGINYAIGENTSTETKYSFTVPILEVLEFLGECGLSPKTDK